MNFITHQNITSERKSISLRAKHFTIKASLASSNNTHFKSHQPQHLATPILATHIQTTQPQHNTKMSSVSAAYMLAADQKRRSSAQTPKSSLESDRSAEQRHAGSLKRAAKKVVQAAKEHHNSVNAAFDAYHGRGAYRNERYQWV
jgi:hypothetical protein